MTLPEVDEVSVLTLVDNVFDALLPSGGGVTRPVMGTGRVPAPQFTSGQPRPGCGPSTVSPPWSPCAGAQHALARALPDAWVQPSVGSRSQLTAA